MTKKIEELKGCILKNTCIENKHLCCHFCKNKKCDDRCLDNIDECKYRCELSPYPEER